MGLHYAGFFAGLHGVLYGGYYSGYYSGYWQITSQSILGKIRLVIGFRPQEYIYIYIDVYIDVYREVYSGKSSLNHKQTMAEYYLKQH